MLHMVIDDHAFCPFEDLNPEISCPDEACPNVEWDFSTLLRSKWRWGGIENLLRWGCKKEGLMQYKCMEREKRTLSMEEFYFPSVMYIAIIPAGIQLWQKGIKNPCIQAPDFPLPLPGAGKRNEFCRFVKNMITHRKSTDTTHIQHEPAFPDNKSRIDAGFSCDLALPPDFREALINSQSLPL